MDVGALASLESQIRCCNGLVQRMVNEECFVLLSGESGSGRTVVCEQLVNETDSKMRAVFIPCSQGMQLQRLRELFLQQLLPGVEFDSNLNLADVLAKVRIPHNHKVLIVVDDVDRVSSAFYNELLTLYEHFLGQARFAFVLVCHPLWAEEKLSRYTGTAEIGQVEMPKLSIKEAIILARHMFALQNTMRIFNAISNKLPDALSAANGNISQIINITEKLMKEPTASHISNASRMAKPKFPQNGGKKKSGSVGIFVTIVCIIIVLACLIPIFFGGNFFSSGSSSQTKAEVANGDSLVFDSGSQAFTPDSSQPQFATDDGVLPPSIPNNGLDAQITEKQTEHSVTLSGDTLDKIEGGAKNSEYPRGVGGSVNQAQQGSSLVSLKRGDNLNHLNDKSMPMQNSNVGMTQPKLPEKEIATLPKQNQGIDATSPALMPQTPQSNNVAPVAPVDPFAKQQAEQERLALEQAAKDKLAADKKKAEEARRLEAEQAKKDAQRLAEEAKRKQAEEEAKKKALAQEATSNQSATQNNAPARPALKAGQIINLGEEQKALKQSQAYRQPQPYVPDNAPQRPPVSTTATANGGQEGNINEIKNIADHRYTVQIVSASNRANISAAARALNMRYWIIETTRSGRPWFILIAGDFASREEAANAARNIPRSVSQGATPFPKRMDDVKAEVR